MAQPRSKPGNGTVDAAEVAQFDALAEEWWDDKGPMRALHRLNPVRLAFIRSRLSAHFARDATSLGPFQNLRILDIGCGGGLVSEPLARLGAAVTGIDVSAENLAVARQHGAAAGLTIDYRESTAEDLAATGAEFDAVVAMEVVEHVADLGLFLGAASALTRPGGAILLATLNRTAKAYALAIVGAERILRWVPRGTHRFDRFVKPSEMRQHLGRHGVTLSHVIGVGFDPLSGTWRQSDDKSVNYMVFASKS